MSEARAARRASAARRRQQREDISPNINKKPTSYVEASTIQDRIRRWQTQDAAEAVDPDVLSVRSLPRSERARTPVRTYSPAQAPDNPQSTPRKRSTKWVQQENNWIKQRRSMREQNRSPGSVRPPVKHPVVEPSIREETPPPVEYSRNDSLRTRNVNSSRAERELRRKRRREARAKADNGHALVEDGIRVYARSESHPASEPFERDTAPARSEIQDDQGSVQEVVHEPEVQYARSTDQGSPHDIVNEHPYRDDEDEGQERDLRQPSRYAQTLGRAPEPVEVIEQPKTRKRIIFNKTREILVGRNDAQPPLSNRIPSIEAWLEEQPDMPDPFVDHKESSLSQPANPPKPPKHRSHRRKVPSEPTIVEVEDPNKIWDSVAPIQQREPRKPSRREPKNVSQQPSETKNPSRRLFSFEVCDEPSKGEECMPQPPIHEVDEPPSPVTLKRRGAKTVRHAQRPLPQVPPSPTQISDERAASQTKHQSGPQTVNQSLPVKRPLPQIPVEPTTEATGSVAEDAVPLDRAPSRGLKRKLTTHEDLLSVLSLPRARRSTRSNLSVRHGEAPSPEQLIRDAIHTMQQEEVQYVRELRTLVDGVTPVLLQSLLSKSDAAATAGLFSDNKNNDADFTRPIIQMGGALERLKNLHARIPLQEQNIENLLSWAVTAHKYYTDYVKAWRLGFQGIIVNLAPLDGTQMKEEDMLSRDIDGDVTNEQGQKVDVAFLQKRPLVRLKKFFKFFATIRDVLPGHKRASAVADMYADLTELAKQRHSEEQGRLEDEAAANTDTTRARDIKTLGITEGIRIDCRRKVRARDNFDMTLQHSNGQRVDCKVEIILRDDPHPSGAGGDILICQVEETSKWLLFTPIHMSNVSVRRDQSSYDLVLMVKGVAGIGRSWHELLALRAEHQEAVTEWLHMLSSNPLPPKLNCTPSWQHVPEQHFPQEPLVAQTPTAPPVPLSRSALLSIPSDVDIPIGEPSVILTRRKKKENTPAKLEEPIAERTPPKLSLGGGLQRRDVSDHYQHVTPTSKNRISTSVPPPERASTFTSPSKTAIKSHVPSHELRPLPVVNREEKSVLQEPLVPKQGYSPQKFAHNRSDLSGVTSTSRNSYFTQPEVKPYADAQTPDETRRLLQEITNAERSWANEPLMSGGLGPASPNENSGEKQSTQDKLLAENDIQQPQVFAHRLRRHSRSKSSSMPLSETIREQWSAMSGPKNKYQSAPNTPEKKPAIHDKAAENDTTPQIRPQLTRESPSSSRTDSQQKPSPIAIPAPKARPPPPPQQKSNFTISYSPRNSMVSLPATLIPENPYCPEPTSPLKNEYQPSSSASGTESDDDETDATSDISDDIGSELKDQATPLVAVSHGNRRASNMASNPRVNAPSSGTRTLDPSDSASNGPYRQAPPPSAYPAEKKKRTIAMVCSWSERGLWEPIRDDVCSIVVSPGLVQAFPMSAAHSQPMVGAEWEEGGDPSAPQQLPLVEFELTPMVPLRKGTGLDITIRSPPTANSTVTATNNVMFRSRTPQENDRLYGYINWARCHNPVYEKLARDRPQQEAVTFASNVQQAKSRSWFSFGSREKTSYRAPSRPPASMADTAASSSSGTSAFSALQRFKKNSPFSLKRSSVVHRPGMDNSGGSLYSASNGTGPSSGSSTPAPSQAGHIPGPEGPNVPQTSAEAANGGGMVNNMRIKFYIRQGQDWRDMGSSLLTILPAGIPQRVSQSNSPGSSTPGGDAIPPQRISRAPTSMPQPRTSHYRLPSSGTTPHRIHGDGREKRILITREKRKEIVLLDEILGESCFEKVAHCGIAVNVWKEEEAVPDRGGVMTGRSKTYMMRFGNSAEASWVFNMCGTYRYGSAAPS